MIDVISNHSLTVKDSYFRRNFCVSGAGALFTGFFGSGTPEVHSSVTVLGSEFIENSAPQGGTITISLPGHQGMYIVSECDLPDSICILHYIVFILDTVCVNCYKRLTMALYKYSIIVIVMSCSASCMFYRSRNKQLCKY